MSSIARFSNKMLQNDPIARYDPGMKKGVDEMKRENNRWIEPQVQVIPYGGPPMTGEGGTGGRKRVVSGGRRSTVIGA